MHHAGQSPAIIEISGVAQIFIAGDEFSGIMLDIESLAQPVSRRHKPRMIGGQSAINQDDDAVDRGAPIGVEMLTISILARGTGLVANRLGR